MDIINNEHTDRIPFSLAFIVHKWFTCMAYWEAWWNRANINRICFTCASAVKKVHSIVNTDHTMAASNLRNGPISNSKTFFEDLN